MRFLELLPRRALRLLGVVLLLALVSPAGAQPIPGDVGEDGGDAPPPDFEDMVPRMTGRPVERIQFRGNRKVEDDAIRVNLLTRVGATFDPSKLREDVRAMWKMGFFADIRVEAEIATGGGAILTFAVTEKPSIRKVLIAGNAELELDKINEVIDLKRDAILDVAKIKRNRQKIQELYVEKGFYLAKVDYDVRPINEAEVDVWFVVDERTKVQIRDVQFIGNEAITDDELRNLIATQKGGALAFLNDSGTFNEEAFERDLLIISAHYWDKGYATVNIGEPQLKLSRDKRYMYLSIPIEEGPVYQVAGIEFRGDLIGTAEEHAAMVGIKPGATFARSTIAADRERLSTSTWTAATRTPTSCR